MTAADTERFRLRRFVERLVQLGECDIHDKPIDLVDVAAVLEGNPRAVWFKAVGPEKAELIGNVMASRKRLALSLDTDEPGLMPELAKRLATPVKPVKVEAKDAPVQQVVLKGEDADLCALPVHLQHGEDGAPYISAGLDFAIFPDTGWTNVGCRRIMLRGPRQAGVDMIAPSDMRAIFLDAVARGEKTPVAYAVGSHPCDFMAAVSGTPPMDELDVLGALRQAPVPVVKCVTNDIYVPADAEYVLEGYLDPKGHTEPEGPYGEYVGYYGIVKRNPVFHVTAITHRKDALFQTVTIGGKSLARTDTAQLTTVKTETAAWAGLVTAVREPVAVFATPSSGGMYNVRVSLRQRVPGEARNAIAAVFGSHGRGEAGVRVRRRHRRVQRRAVRLGAGDAFPGQPRHDRGGWLPRGAARSLARRPAGRRQGRVRLHHPVRQAAVAGMGHPDAAGDAEDERQGQALRCRRAGGKTGKLP